MNILELPVYYLFWHYTTALADILRIYQNLVWFVGRFFSMSLLFSTLFSPWKRMVEKEENDFFGNLIVNTITRIAGFFIRSFAILAGLLCMLIITIGAIIFFILWIFLPVILAVILIAGWRIFYR